MSKEFETVEQLFSHKHTLLGGMLYERVKYRVKYKQGEYIQYSYILTAKV